MESFALRSRYRPLVLLGLLAAAAGGVVLSRAAAGKHSSPAAHTAPTPPAGAARVLDEAGLLPAASRGKFEQYLSWIFQESDIDIRLVFVKGTGAKSIEELAVDRVRELRIGGRNREERGLLLLFDVEGRRMRAEVGYGLEAYFPDSFVGYLMRDHTRHFFSSGDPITGIRLMLFMLHHRIREEVVGNHFDPRVLDTLEHRGNLSGGAGASAPLDVLGEPRASLGGRASGSRPAADLNRPQPTPAAAYGAYLEWLVRGDFQPSVGLLTPESQAYVASLPMTPAYFHYILMQEYGRAHRIETRGDRALLYFTDTPLVSPHFLRKSAAGWQMDIAAEVASTRNFVGGVFTWGYIGHDDPYSAALYDKFVRLKGGTYRIVDGDNRELPTRDSAKETDNEGNRAAASPGR